MPDPPSPSTRHPFVDDVTAPDGRQFQAEISREVVADNAEAIRDGADFPPVVVFFDGTAHWLADGLQRYEAHATPGAHEIPADLRRGLAARRDPLQRGRQRRARPAPHQRRQAPRGDGAAGRR